MIQKDSDAESHLTILNPRESPAMGSRMGDLITNDDLGDFWSSRAEFVFATLLYCLNIGNLWRFPTQAMRYGEGAFLYVYLIFNIIFGIPLLFFEVAIGQYTNKGLMNVFHIVPVMEGISISMVFVSNILVHVYDMISVFNFIYIFSFIRENAPLSDATNHEVMCFYENRTNSLENLHFHNEVVMVSDDFQCIYNARNLCIVFVLWMMIWVYTANEYTIRKHFTMLLYIFVVCSLVITLIATVTVTGAGDGITRLLSPPWSNFLSYELYLHAFEQSLITLGLGMGPLINFGSYTTFRTPIHIDAITINFCTLITSLMMTLIIFGSIGIWHAEQGVSEAKLVGQEYYVHVLMSKLFIRMTKGYSNFNIALFHMAFFAAGFYCSVKYAELMIQFIYAMWDFNPKHNAKIVCVFCACQFCIGSGMLTYHGLGLLYWGASNIFTVFSVLTLVALETTAIAYIYRMRNFCDDAEFMIGYKPTWCLKIIWYSTPFFCLAAIVASCVEYYYVGVNWYDGFSFIVYVAVVLLPFLIQGLISTVRAIRRGQLSRIFYPREVLTDFQEYLNWRETASLNSKLSDRAL